VVKHKKRKTSQGQPADIQVRRIITYLQRIYGTYLLDDMESLEKYKLPQTFYKLPERVQLLVTTTVEIVRMPWIDCDNQEFQKIDDEKYMMNLEKTISPDMLFRIEDRLRAFQYLVNCIQDVIEQPDITTKELKSSATTNMSTAPGTSISSMIATTIAVNADATSSLCSLHSKLDTLCAESTSPGKISSVNSYISVKKGSTSRVFTLEQKEDPGFLIQIRCWRKPQIQGVPDIEHASASTNFYCSEPSRTNSRNVGTTSSSNGRRNHGSGGSYLRQKVNFSFNSEMEDFIISHLCVPVDSIVRSSTWLESPFRYIRSGDDRFRSVLDVINSRISSLSVKE
jgi:hypothetical protein